MPGNVPKVANEKGDYTPQTRRVSFATIGTLCDRDAPVAQKLVRSRMHGGDFSPFAMIGCLP